MITSNLISSNSWHFPYTKTWKLRKEQVEFSEFCINRLGIFSTIEFRYQQNIYFYLFQTIFLHLTPFILIKKAFKNVQNYLPTEVQEDNFHWVMVESLVKDAKLVKSLNRDPLSWLQPLNLTQPHSRLRIRWNTTTKKRLLNCGW